MSRDALPRANGLDPWQGVRIDPVALRLAEAAAAAAGLSFAEWLERAIRRACQGGVDEASAIIPAAPVPVVEPAPALRRALTQAEHLAQRRADDAGNDPAADNEMKAQPRIKRLAISAAIGTAIVLAITAGAVTAQYLIPSPSHAPLSPSLQSDNAAPTTSLASLPTAPAPASAPSVSAPAVPHGEAPAANEAAPVTTASAAVPSQLGQGDVAPVHRQALVPWLEQRAENGDTIAQYRLGVLYALGQGVQQDYRRAADLFKASAEAGIAEAQYDIAVMYGNGIGIDRDPNQAAEWYQKAAAQGNPNAEFNLGVAYSSGVGVQQNIDQAAQWFRRAAVAGVVNAQFNLAILYERGTGVPVSQVEAYAWYSVAADRGDKGAAERRDHLAATLAPATLKDAQGRAEQIAATITNGSHGDRGAATIGGIQAAAPQP